MEGDLAKPLAPYVVARARDVIATTGYRVAIEEADVLEFDSEVRYASTNSPLHRIRISKSYSLHRDHFVLSSLEKIHRFFATPPGDRYLPLVAMDGRLSPREENDLRRRNPLASDEVLMMVSKHMRAGLVRQLLSFPLDLRVEQELHQGIDEHRACQLAYLKQQVLDLEEHFSREIEAFSPPQAYAASSAMNFALVEFCTSLSGERPGKRARFSPHRKKGQRLLGLLQEIREPGHGGDRKAQDAWARELGFVGVYEWVRADADRSGQ